MCPLACAGPPPQRYAANYDETGHDTGRPLGGQGSTTPHVFSVTVVKSACFYGYNPCDEPFLRITMCGLPLTEVVMRACQGCTTAWTAATWLGS